jgi:molybdopterin-guanine dinucleotide biosynthesis protein B
MKIFGLAGWSGSGKTTLMVKLLPALIGRGLTVSTMKHTHHSFDIDKPGKDSYEHRAAGATEVMITSAKRWALLRELRDEPEPDMDAQIARMTPVDLLLIEGFKTNRHPKMEIHRPAIGKPLLCTGDPTVVAIATDAPLHGVRVPVFDLDDVRAIADFIVAHCGLGARRKHGAA